MGSTDNFSLRWNEFESNITSSFGQLRDCKEFFDITLCSGNGEDCVQAHKVILAACSPFFRRVLAKLNGQQNPFIYLKGVKMADLTAVLSFMYQGKVSVAQNALDSFLSVAEDLEVKGLTTNQAASTVADEAMTEKKRKRNDGNTSTTNTYYKTCQKRTRGND